MSGYSSRFLQPPRHDIGGATGTGAGQMTIITVAGGPSSRETRNYAQRERFFCWASPALIRATVNQKKPELT